MVLDEIANALQAGSAKKVKELTEQALAEGVAPGDIISRGLIPAMNEVGVKFKNNEIYVPEVLVSARAMHTALGILKPRLAESKVQSKGKVVMGTVKGDLHDIGKNLVCMMFEGAGFEVVDIGIDAGPEKFVAAVNEHKPQIIGMSALLTTTMTQMKETIDALTAAGVRDKVKIMVGGAPVTQKFADEIGADGFALNATLAVDKARELLGVV